MDELLVTLVIVVMSAISAWLQKRRQGNSPVFPEDDDSPAPLDTRPKSTKADSTGGFDWEKELRRILGGEEASPPPASAPPSPSVIKPLPAPRALVQPETEIVYTESEETHAREMGNLTTAATAIERARLLSTSTATRLHQSHEPSKRPLSALPHSNDRVASIIALSQLRNPSSARQAIILTAILGPPKALDVSEN